MSKHRQKNSRVVVLHNRGGKRVNPQLVYAITTYLKRWNAQSNNKQLKFQEMNVQLTLKR